jgi:two-component system sensor histidine kinase CreC
MRLRVIIFGLFVGLGGLGFAALMLYVVWETRPAVVASMRVTMTDLARTIAASVELELEESDAVEDPLSFARREVDRLSSGTLGLRLLFVSDEAFEERFVNAKLLYDRKLLRSKRYGDGEERVFLQDDALIVMYPIVSDGRNFAYVGVGRPLALARELILRSRWEIVGIGSIIGLLTLLAGWWLSSRLTHSLERLANYAVAWREGETPRFKPSKSLEIQQLAKAFDSMRKALDGKAYVEQYTQSLAHALKAPLAGVRASSEILMEDPKEADKQRFLGHILDESQRMDSIVEKLLRLASLESGTVQMDTKRFDLGVLAAERAASFAWAKAARGIDIEVEADGIEVSGDSFWLGEAIAEMLSNAVEFSANGGVARLRVFRESNRVLVTVSDDGQGIPEWAVERVSERFYSLPRDYSGKKGTGLGLALVREVARLHGGSFSLENRLKGGAMASLEIVL